MYVALLLLDSRDTQNLIWIDAQGSLTLIVQRYSNLEVLVAPGLPNGQGKGGGAGTWAERWDKGEGAMGWGGALG